MMLDSGCSMLEAEYQIFGIENPASSIEDRLFGAKTSVKRRPNDVHPED
jgi:hypothetical protein